MSPVLTPEEPVVDEAAGGDSLQSPIGNGNTLIRDSNSSSEFEKLVADVSFYSHISRTQAYRAARTRHAHRETDRYTESGASEMSFETVTCGTITSTPLSSRSRCFRSFLSAQNPTRKSSNHFYTADQARSDESLLHETFCSSGPWKTKKKDFSYSATVRSDPVMDNCSLKSSIIFTGGSSTVEKCPIEHHSKFQVDNVRALILFLAILLLIYLRFWMRDGMKQRSVELRRFVALHDTLKTSIATAKSGFLFWMLCDTDE